MRSKKKDGEFIRQRFRLEFPTKYGICLESELQVVNMGFQKLLQCGPKGNQERNIKWRLTWSNTGLTCSPEMKPGWPWIYVFQWESRL